MSTDTTTAAQIKRNQHVAKVKAEIVRLTNAVAEFEKYTTQYPDWEYVGDWASLAQDVTDATDRAESMARQTNQWWKVTK